MTSQCAADFQQRQEVSVLHIFAPLNATPTLLQGGAPLDPKVFATLTF